MSEGTPPPVLRVELPGVVSWSRPRRMRGGVRHPAAYARVRDAWSLLVALAVREARWQPPPAARYHVAVGVAGGGRRDLDRVCTAVLDALQAGGAVRDDCLVDELTAARSRAPRESPPATAVEVSALPAGPVAKPCPTAPPAGSAGERQTEEHHAH
jgi:Holliday junction resolvase RusA-like endonuclease